MDKPLYTDNVNESYEQYKKALKERYAMRINCALDDIKEQIAITTRQILGEEFFVISERLEQLKTQTKEMKSEYFSDGDYSSEQAKLSKFNREMNEVDADKKKQVIDEMKKSLSKITTMNVTLDNRLKEYNCKIKECEAQLGEITSSKKELLDNFKRKIMKNTEHILVECVSDYNVELNQLKQTFGVSGTDFEFPFDDNAIKLEVPLFDFCKNLKRKEVVNEQDGTQSTFILSKNTNVTKN